METIDTDTDTLTLIASDLSSLLDSLTSLLEYVEVISSVLSLLLIINLLIYGTFLFRIVVLGKNQRSLW